MHLLPARHAWIVFERWIAGGALVNARGELIGINAASLEPSLQPYGLSLPEGIGFAIPVNLARGVMAELIEHGRVLRGGDL